MKISYNWLKEYIDIRKSPKELAALLTNSGSEVKAMEKIDGDCVMDIEITPNRSDCLSYIGIAREVSAVIGKAVKMPPIKIKKQKTPGMAPFTVDIEDKDLCPRYTARLICDVTVGQSPDWLKKKITSMGLRPVNSVVDITNFVLFELGQPMHAFDYDNIEKNSIIIRRACQGEEITAIDNVKRKLDKNALIIADSEKAIAIGGVMGGLNTEVTESTKNILLESAYFNPISIRRTSFKLALISESSYRFERGVDPDMVLGASDRAALLIAGICGGKIAQLVDKGSKRGRKRKITLRMGQLNKILNLNLKDSYVKKALSGLSLKASSFKRGILSVSIPSFRQDLRYEIDIIEEAARIYGYKNIANTIPEIIPPSERKSASWRAKEFTGNALASLGLSEVLTYSLIGEKAIYKVFGDSFRAIAVKNPISAEQELMRPSLIGGILNVLSYNIKRGIRDLKIFEMGGVYIKGSHNEYIEKTNLCIALTGIASGDWQRGKDNVTFYDLRGTLEELFRKLGLKDFSIAEKDFSFMAKSASSEIYCNGKAIGAAGCLAGNIVEAFDLKQDVFLAELDFEGIVSSANLGKAVKDVPKYPSVKRDISLIAGGDVSFDKIASLVKRHGGELVESVQLFDKYTGKQIPQGHYGLAFRIEYRDRKKTLTAEAVDKMHSAIRQSLAHVLKATLR